MRRTLAVLLLATLPACRTATGPAPIPQTDPERLAFQGDSKMTPEAERDPAPRLKDLTATVVGGSTVIRARLVSYQDNDLWTLVGSVNLYTTNVIVFAPEGQDRWPDTVTMYGWQNARRGTVRYWKDRHHLVLTATPAFTGTLTLGVIGNEATPYTVTIRTPAAGGHLAEE